MRRKIDDFAIYIGKKNEKLENYVMGGKCDLFAMYVCMGAMLYLLAQVIRSFFQ